MYCNHCGQYLEDDKKFCTNCGMPVTKRQSVEANEDNTIEKPNKAMSKGRGMNVAIIALIAVIVLLLGGILFFVFLNNKNPNDSEDGNTSSIAGDESKILARIYDANYSSPDAYVGAEGVTVTLYKKNGETSSAKIAEQIVGTDGRVEFAGLDVGDYLLTVNGEPYLSTNRTIPVDGITDCTILVPRTIAEGEAIVVAQWNCDSDLDLCLFNADKQQTISIGNPTDIEGDFLYADHPSGYEMLYIKDANSFGVKTFYVIDADHVSEGSSSMEDEGVILSVYNANGLLYQMEAKKDQSSPVWLPGYLYMGVYNEVDSYISDVTGDYAWTLNTKEGIFLDSKVALVKAGDSLYLGSYEQDNISSNGKEPILWDVLDVQDGKALLLSRYVLDSMPYNYTAQDVTWENCDERIWLNGFFYQEAFGDSERGVIEEVENANHNNPFYGSEGGNATKDKVALLSVAQAQKYFTLYSFNESEGWGYTAALMAEPTAYAISRGVKVHYIDWDEFNNNMTIRGYSYNLVGLNSCYWSLRTVGQNNKTVCHAGYIGGIGYGKYYHDISSADAGVRPAIWVNVDKLLYGAANVESYAPSQIYELADVRDTGYSSVSGDPWEAKGYKMTDQIKSMGPGSVIEIEFNSDSGYIWIVLPDAKKGWTRIGVGDLDGSRQGYTIYNADHTIAQIPFELIANYLGYDVSAWGDRIFFESDEGWVIFRVYIGTYDAIAQQVAPAQMPQASDSNNQNSDTDTNPNETSALNHNESQLFTSSEWKEIKKWMKEMNYCSTVDERAVGLYGYTKVSGYETEYEGTYDSYYGSVLGDAWNVFMTLTNKRYFEEQSYTEKEVFGNARIERQSTQNGYRYDFYYYDDYYNENDDWKKLGEDENWLPNIGVEIGVEFDSRGTVESVELCICDDGSGREYFFFCRNESDAANYVQTYLF